MQYREVKPTGAAKYLVQCYWTLQHDSSIATPQRIVPDGRTELILNLGRPYESQTEAGWKAQPRCFFMGQITGPLVLRPSGAASMIGIRFHPHTASRLLEVPIRELTDVATSLDDISPRLFRELDEVEGLADLDRMLNARALRIVEDDGLLGFAARQLERMEVAAVARRTGLSARQFERRFTAAVGIPPKLFSRMQRFQRVFRALEDNPAGWADAAVQCGYYDQAHLIRDFREFAGKAPAALLAKETDLARHFVQLARMSHFSNTRP